MSGLDAPAPLTLQTLLGDYPTTHALRQGQVASSVLSLRFADVAVPNRAFKRAVRDLEFDVAELALMTFLMARSRGVALRLLPVVIFGRNPLPFFVCCPDRRRVEPGQLAGTRIGVRSYTTTTAVWIRELVADRFGCDWTTVEWIALDEAHVADVADPVNVRRQDGAADLLTLLRSGAVDAAIVDRPPTDPAFAAVVPDLDEVWQAWQTKHHARTVNHVVVVRESLAENEELMGELFNLFRASRDIAGAAIDREATPIGFTANRRNLEVAIAVAGAQGLLAQRLAVADLFTPALLRLE